MATDTKSIATTNGHATVARVPDWDAVRAMSFESLVEWCSDKTPQEIAAVRDLFTQNRVAIPAKQMALDAFTAGIAATYQRDRLVRTQREALSDLALVAWARLFTATTKQSSADRLGLG